MLVDEVVDEVPSVLVLQGSLVYSSLVEKLLQIGINIFQVKSVVGVPANMTDVLEVGGQPDIFLLYLPLRGLLGHGIDSRLDWVVDTVVLCRRNLG